MVPVEAMASGRPVVAYGRGGAVETVVSGVSGIFFNEHTVEAISAAVASLANISFDPGKITRHAGQFGRDQFFAKMRAHIEDLQAKRHSSA
jgi:glycosyltransferase involved in cell wall biosynthesis